MKAINWPSLGMAKIYGDVRALGMRTLILTILAMALMNIAILTALSRTSGEFDESLRGPPMVRQAAAAARLMDELEPNQRIVALAAINSPSLRLSLNEDFSDTPPVANPSEVFVPIISVYKAVLGDRPFSVYKRVDSNDWPWPVATLAHDLIIVMRLSDGSGLVVENGEQFRRMIGIYGVAFVVGVLSLVLVGLMMWASLSYAGPLGRLAHASNNFVKAAYSDDGLTPLPENGPKPVRQLAAALNLAGTKLVQLTIERTNTLAAVAHDLRTYLTRLRMRSEFIEDDTQREKTIRDIEDMTRLIEDTLSLGRAVTKQSASERLNLGDWLEEFVAHRTELGEPLTLLPFEHAAEVEVVEPELKRVLNNLVDNGLRYGGATTLALHSNDPDTVDIEILDDGPGVPDAFIDRMQEPFTRIEASRSRDTGGAGLGLAISKALIEQVGGTLHLSNRESGGFCARITLQRAQGDSA